MNHLNTITVDGRARRYWLRQLIAALQTDNPDAILTGLRIFEKEFKP